MSSCTLSVRSDYSLVNSERMDTKKLLLEKDYEIPGNQMEVYSSMDSVGSIDESIDIPIQKSVNKRDVTRKKTKTQVIYYSDGSKEEIIKEITANSVHCDSHDAKSKTTSETNITVKIHPSTTENHVRTVVQETKIKNNGELVCKKYWEF